MHCYPVAAFLSDVPIIAQQQKKVKRFYINPANKANIKTKTIGEPP